MTAFVAAPADAAGGHSPFRTEVKLTRSSEGKSPAGGGPEAGGGPSPENEWLDARPNSEVKQVCMPPAELLKSLAEGPYETVFADPPKALHDHAADDARALDPLLIRNLDTGEIRSFDSGMLTQSFIGPEADPKEILGHAARPWQSWWSDKETRENRLWDAARSGDLAQLQDMLMAHADGSAPVSVDARTHDGHTALHLAALSGHAPVVQKLLENRADVNYKTGRGSTALHIASQRGDLVTAKLLLKFRANVACETAEKNQAIHLAAVSGHAEVVKALLAVDGVQQLSSRNLNGQCPAEAAVDIDTALCLQSCRAQAAAVEPKMVSQLRGISEDHYAQRTSFCEGVLLRNARADAVQRLLRMTTSLRDVGVESADDDPTPAPSPVSSASGFMGRASSNSCGQTSPKVRAPFARVRSKGPDPENIGPSSFELIKLLGRGSFGEVFHVKHKRTEQEYAMKVLQKTKIMSSNLLKYAVTERNILAYVQHPYIVTLHYAFQTPSHLVLVLQYCPRGNLQHLIQREKRLQLSISRLYTCEILLALIHLHERKTLFRDLKPDNVVLDEKNHAMLTDFGLSKEGVAGSRGTKSFCGSVAFLAPEILLRQGHGHTVDIYNLGVLLYDMLTGFPPFYHQDRETLFANIKHAKLEVPDYVPRAARALIYATMQREPSRRLGAEQTTDVKDHVFFDGIDFDAVMRREIPVPALTSPRGQQWNEQPLSPLTRAVPESPFARADWAAGWRARYSRGREGQSCRSEPVSGWTFAEIPRPETAEMACTNELHDVKLVASPINGRRSHRGVAYAVGGR